MKVRKVTGTLAIALVVGIVAAGCGSKGSTTPSASAAGVPLKGDGATFPQPIYALWFKDFQKVESGAQISYTGTGSGQGVTDFTGQIVDFAGSDPPLQAAEVSALPGTALEFPMVIGGVVVAYNVQGIDSGLKLDGATTADIFLGKITTWNDPAIAQQNPGVNLPSTPISIVHRQDASGTTKVFTAWLSAASPQWASQVGSDKDLGSKWPVGTGGSGNDGVAAGISQTDGSVGYLSFDFAVTAKLGVAAIKNASGDYVTASVDSISAAGASLKLPITPDTSILNSTASGAYPIATTTYMLVYQDQKDQAKGQTLVDLVYWCLTKGQSEVQTLNFSPLPSSVVQGALQELNQVTFNGTPITPSSAVSSSS